MTSPPLVLVEMMSDTEFHSLKVPHMLRGHAVKPLDENEGYADIFGVVVKTASCNHSSYGVGCWMTRSVYGKVIAVILSTLVRA